MVARFLRPFRTVLLSLSIEYLLAHSATLVTSQSFGDPNARWRWSKFFDRGLTYRQNIIRIVLVFSYFSKIRYEEKEFRELDSVAIDSKRVRDHDWPGNDISTNQRRTFHRELAARFLYRFECLTNTNICFSATEIY